MRRDVVLEGAHDVDELVRVAQVTQHLSRLPLADAYHTGDVDVAHLGGGARRLRGQPWSALPESNSFL